MFKKKSGTAEAVKDVKKAEKKLRRKAPTDADRHDRYVLVKRSLTIVRCVVHVAASATLVALLATSAVPVSIVALSNLLGVGYDSIGLDIVFVFGMPSQFLVGCWISFTRWLVRRMGAGLKSFFDGLAERANPANKTESR